MNILDKEEYDRLNGIRLDLIEKKYTVGLSDLEKEELADVTKQVLSFEDWTEDRDRLHEIEKRWRKQDRKIDRLLRKVGIR